MPKTYGVKDKDVVVAHVVDLVLSGKFRTGDRIDRNEVARELGVSRVPVQEAVVQLEHDGIITTQYHRGAFVERFDEATIIEHHQVYGLLSGLASARAAADPKGRILPKLGALTRTLRTTTDPLAFFETAWEYRETIYADYAGPRLAAMIRASQSFIPQAFWTAYQDNHDRMLPFYEAETIAIGAHAAEDARAANIARSELMAKTMIAELADRKVFDNLTSG
ncbi:MAG: transcriptional regulator PdhR [Pseudonocardiales bacterium]|nr:transcriptional regulator PdhR [Pseudonocardiales bacterium]